jgi:hypothetical protein
MAHPAARLIATGFAGASGLAAVNDLDHWGAGKFRLPTSMASILLTQVRFGSQAVTHSSANPEIGRMAPWEVEARCEYFESVNFDN